MNNNKIHPKTRKCKDEVSRHLVSLKEAGQMLGLSTRTVRSRSYDGQLPPIVKIGHSSKISYQGVIDYISSLTAKLGSIALL